MLKNRCEGSSIDDLIEELMAESPENREILEKEFLINSICHQIVEARKQKKMSQNALGQSIGTKQSNIARLERGNLNKLPTVDFLYKIARGLGRKLVIRFE